MKKKLNIQANIVSLLISTILLMSASSCEDLFNDPLKDKDTGEDITVLLLDRNFINTKLKIWFVDDLRAIF